MTETSTEPTRPSEAMSAPAPRHADNYIRGMGAALVAYLMMATMNVLAKILSENHHVIEVAFYRNLVGVMPFIFMICAMGRREIATIRGNGRDIVIRSVLGTVSLAVTFAAYAAMPLADTVALLFTSSLIVPVLAFLLLGERVGIFRWSVIAIGFVGVLIMVRPTGDMNTLGVTLALMAAMSHAVLQVLLRKLGRTERPETVTFYFLGIGAILTAIPMPFVFRLPGLSELPFLLGVGLCGVIMQMALSIAFKYAPADIVSVFNYSGIIWATAFGWFIWNDWPTMPVWIGGSIVIASNIIILWRESRLAIRRDAKELPPT